MLRLPHPLGRQRSEVVRSWSLFLRRFCGLVRQPITRCMILVTGGAGFIGSNLHAALVARGVETVIADRLGHDGKWRNLAKHPPARLIPPQDIEEFLDSRPP